LYEEQKPNILSKVQEAIVVDDSSDEDDNDNDRKPGSTKALQKSFMRLIAEAKKRKLALLFVHKEFLGI
jgi:hypothetical protein